VNDSMCSGEHLQGDGQWKPLINSREPIRDFTKPIVPLVYVRKGLTTKKTRVFFFLRKKRGSITTGAYSTRRPHYPSSRTATLVDTQRPKLSYTQVPLSPPVKRVICGRLARLITDNSPTRRYHFHLFRGYLRSARKD